MNNEFLNILKESFNAYITDGERSNSKLKFLHEKISLDIEKTILNLKKDNNDIYKCHSLNQGNGKEIEIQGKYMPKRIDITITRNNKVVAGVSVKFIMSNFKQNKNNYFESMLGETANIRANKIPYYQFLVAFDKIPYFSKDGRLKKWESITEEDLKKYIILSSEDSNFVYHCPDKIFIGLVGYDYPHHIENKEEFINYFENKSDYSLSFSKSVNLDIQDESLIYNDYERFINKICHHILSK